MIEAAEEDNPGKTIRVDDKIAYVRIDCEGELILRRDTRWNARWAGPSRCPELEVNLGSFAGRIETSGRRPRALLLRGKSLLTETAMSQPEVPKPLKTWSHLAGRRRKPSEYEIVSTNLHFSTTDNPDAPFELDPNFEMARWFKQHRNASPLQHPDWNAFRDPDEMVYRTYNMQQDGQETYVPGLFDQFSRAATTRCSSAPGPGPWRGCTRRRATCSTPCRWRRPT